MDSPNAVNSSRASEQQDSVIPDVVHTSISANPGRPNEGQLDRNPVPREVDIPEIAPADQTGTSIEDTTPQQGTSNRYA